MSKFITFEEAVRKKIIKEGDLVDPKEIFSREIKEIILTSKETGWKDEQTISFEDLSWFYADDSKGIPTLWGSTTSEKIYLQGAIGYLNGVTAINKICWALYSNMSLGVVARSATEDDIVYLRKKDNTKSKIIINNGPAWLGNSCVRVCDKNDGYFGIRYIVGNEINYSPLFNVKKEYYSNKNCMPAISLYPLSKILVDIEQKGDAWNLIPIS